MTIFHLKYIFNMQKNSCLYRVDNNIIDNFMKNCVTDKTEKKLRNRENGRSYFQTRFVIEV